MSKSKRHYIRKQIKAIDLSVACKHCGSITPANTKNSIIALWELLTILGNVGKLAKLLKKDKDAEVVLKSVYGALNGLREDIIRKMIDLNNKAHCKASPSKKHDCKIFLKFTFEDRKSITCAFEHSNEKQAVVVGLVKK